MRKNRNLPLLATSAVLAITAATSASAMMVAEEGVSDEVVVEDVVIDREVVDENIVDEGAIGEEVVVKEDIIDEGVADDGLVIEEAAEGGEEILYTMTGATDDVVDDETVVEEVPVEEVAVDDRLETEVGEEFIDKELGPEIVYMNRGDDFGAEAADRIAEQAAEIASDQAIERIGVAAATTPGASQSEKF